MFQSSVVHENQNQSFQVEDTALELQQHISHQKTEVRYGSSRFCFSSVC